MAGTTREPGTAELSPAEAVLREAVRKAPTTAVMTGLRAPQDAVRSGPEDTAAGELLRDRGWLAEQVRSSALRWRTDSTRTAATLWWYTASTVLLAPPLVTGFVTGCSVHPGPDGLVLHFAEPGRLTAARPAPHIAPPVDGDAAAEVRALLDVCADGLAAVAGLRPRPLWALAADSLTQLLLRAGRETGRIDDSTACALSLADRIGHPLPRPRWVDVAVPDGSDGLFPVPPSGARTEERFVRRGSCCLIYETPDEGKCAGCPRRTPSERALQLELAASRMAFHG